MFPVDTLASSYCEERAAADEASRIMKQEQEAAKKTQQPAQAAPQNLTQAFLQRPPLSRPGSSGFLGNIFQGFVKAAATTPPMSQSATPTTSNVEDAAGVNPTSLKAEIEKLRAEQMRDADYVRCALNPMTGF